MKYRYKRRPYVHQAHALRSVLEGFRERRSHALLMEPRTGKTKVAVDAAAVLHGMDKVDRVLITCPISVIGVWLDEIEANCPVPYKVLVWDRKARKTTSLPPWGIGRLTFVIVNDDAFSTAGVALSNGARSTKRGGRYEVKRALLKWQPQLIVIDESHRFKKASGNKARIMRSIAPHADYRLILTGTPLTKAKKTQDIYSQWKILNPESPLVKDETSESFKARFGIYRTMPVPGHSHATYERWLRNRNEPLLKRLLHEEAFAVKRDECFDLPPRTDQVIHVPLTGQNAEIYDRMAADMVAKIQTGEYTEASIRLVLNLRLAQLTSGIAKTVPTSEHPEGRLVRIGNDKLTMLKDRLTDLYEAEEKVVIAARFKADLAAIVKVSKSLRAKTFELHGSVPIKERDGQIRGFRDTPGPAAFVMQPQAGSLGIDLSTASIVIWYSLPGGQWVNFSQAEDRVALSPRPTFFEYLIAEGTYDEILLETLQEDGDVAKAIIESPERLLRNFKVAGKK